MTFYHYLAFILLKVALFESSDDKEKLFSLPYFYKRNVPDTGIDFSTDCIPIGIATDLDSLPCPTKQNGNMQMFRSSY